MTQPALFALTDGGHSGVTEGGAQMLSNTQKGIISELEFAKQAVLRGWDIILPGGSQSDFDVILKKAATRLLTIQIKRSSEIAAQPGTFRVRCNVAGSLGRPQRLYSATAFDILAAHICPLDSWVFYTRSELGNRQATSYTLPTHRKISTSKSAPVARNLNNWELLDQVAAMYSQESLGVTQQMSHPILNTP